MIVNDTPLLTTFPRRRVPLETAVPAPVPARRKRPARWAASCLTALAVAVTPALTVANSAHASDPLTVRLKVSPTAPTTTVCALSPDRQGVYRFTGTTWRRIGGPAGSLYSGGYGLFATNPVSGDLYRWNGGTSWTRVGGPGATFAVTKTGLYGLSPDRQSVWSYNGGGVWTQIGGPAGWLYGGDFGLFATNPTTGALYRYSPSTGAWSHAGGPGATFAVTGNGLYGLSPDRQGVFRYLGDDSWTQVGGPAGWLYGGGYGLVATNPVTGDPYRYSSATGGWTRIGGPGATFAVAASTVFGLAPDRQGVDRYLGGGQWRHIGGPAADITACR